MHVHRVRVAGALVAIAALVAFAAPARAQADAATDWNQIAANSLFDVAGQPAFSLFHMAMIHGAAYDAVNAIDRGHEAYLVTPRAMPWDSRDAAVAAAAHSVLVSIVPAQTAALDALYASYIASVPDSAAAKAGGIAAGEQAAAAMIAARTGDGRFGAFRFTPGTAVGQWRPELPLFVSDPFAWVKDVKPFMIRSNSRYRSDAPPALTSRKYTRDFNEVAAVGPLVGSTRTDQQTNDARYWYENPPRTWSRIYRTLAVQQGLSTVDSARLYAMFYLTASDAIITVWESKAHWSSWRPITAIREAANDGNPDTNTVANWAPLLATPPYPDQPSGHSSLSSSAVATLQDFFRTDRIGWTDTNVGPLGGPRQTRAFTRFSEAIQNVVDARVWEGIHFRFADVAGAKIGRQVAAYRARHFFGSTHDDGDDEGGEGGGD